MRSPASGCRRTSAHSSALSSPGRLSTSAGTISLPTSCSRAPMRNQNSELSSRPALAARAPARSATRSQCPWVCTSFDSIDSPHFRTTSRKSASSRAMRRPTSASSWRALRRVKQACAWLSAWSISRLRPTRPYSSASSRLASPSRVRSCASPAISRARRRCRSASTSSPVSRAMMPYTFSASAFARGSPRCAASVMPRSHRRFASA